MTQPEDLAPGDHLDPDERDLEAPAHDAAEQARAADPGDDATPSVSSSVEAPEWDALEQSMVVQFEDDYR